MTHARRIHVRHPGLVAPLGVLVFLLAPVPLAAADVPERPTARPTAPAATVLAPKTLAIAQLPVPCWGCPEAREVAGPVPDRPRPPRPARQRRRERRGLLQGLREAGRAAARRGDGRDGAARRRPGGAGEGPPAGRPAPPRGRALVRPGDDALLPGLLPAQGLRHAAPEPARPADAREVVGRTGSRPEGPDAGDGRLPPGDPARAGSSARRTPRSSPTSSASPASASAPQGVYDLARRTGDAPLALVAATVLGEHAPQRLLTAERVTKVDAHARTFARPAAASWSSRFPTALRTPSSRWRTGRARAPVPRRGDHHARHGPRPRDRQRSRRRPSRR